eukprot:scaffold1054_cov366-Prasinococcus_capsulatus_cf.AAC.17
MVHETPVIQENHNASVILSPSGAYEHLLKVQLRNELLTASLCTSVERQLTTRPVAVACKMGPLAVHDRRRIRGALQLLAPWLAGRVAIAPPPAFATMVAYVPHDCGRFALLQVPLAGQVFVQLPMGVEQLLHQRRHSGHGREASGIALQQE